MRQTLRATIGLLLLLSGCQGQMEEGPAGLPAPAVTRSSPPTEDGYRTADVRLPPPMPDPPRPPAGDFFRTPNHPLFGTYAAQPPPRPISGGTLLVLPGRWIAVASDPDRDRLYVADLARVDPDQRTLPGGGPALMHEIVLPAGSEPGRLASDASGRVFAVLRSGGALVTLAPDTFELTEQRPVCPAPRGLAVLPDGGGVVVACAGGELTAWPVTGGPALWTSTLERDLRDVVVDGSTLVVTTFRSARAIVTDLQGHERARTGPPVSLNLTRRSRSGPEGPASTRFQPSVAWRTVAAPGGGVLMLHQRAFTGELPVDPQSGGSGYGGDNCGGGPVQSVVSTVGPSAPRLPSPELNDAVLMVDLALSADGKNIALVGPGNAHATGSALLAGPLAQATESSDQSGCQQAILTARGDGAWWLGNGSTLVRSRLPGEAVAVAFGPGDKLVVQMRNPPQLVLVPPGLPAPVPTAPPSPSPGGLPPTPVPPPPPAEPAPGVVVLSTEVRADTGHEIFHANSGAGIACASCHPEGAEDGRVWRFSSLGPRRTQSLRGGITATAPLHWDGDMHDLGDIAREVYRRRMGGPPLQPSEVTALSAWLDSIPLLPVSAPGDAAAVERGRALFESGQTGCAACHNGPHLTNNQNADVGTGRALQVPALLGLSARAPYMHTGCAATAAGRFDPACGGANHGVTATLTPQQAADLQAYLESL